MCNVGILHADRNHESFFCERYSSHDCLFYRFDEQFQETADPMTWHLLDHPADIGILVEERSVPELLSETIRALLNIQFPDQPETFSPESMRKYRFTGIQHEAKGLDQLSLEIIDLLNLFLTRQSLRNQWITSLCFDRWEYLSSGLKYSGFIAYGNQTLLGEPVIEIKALTYSGLSYTKRGALHQIQLLADV